MNILNVVREDKELRWFEKLFNSSHIGILVVDEERKNLLVNPHLCEMFGYKEEELLGKNTEIFHISYQSYLNFATKAFNMVLKGGSVDLEYPFRKKDGTRIWVRISGDTIRKDHEVLWTLIDITAKVHLEQDLQAKKKQLLTMNALVHLGTWEVDLKTNRIVLSDEMRRIIGVKERKDIDFNDYIDHILHPDDVAIVQKGLQTLLSGGETEGSHLRIYRDDGKGTKEIRYVYQKGLLFYDEDGEKLKLIGATQDITEYKQLEMELQEQKELFEYQAYHDVLTGLPNRLLLKDRLSEKIKYAKRHKKKLAVLFIDLDNFKSLNDSLGHNAGDCLLQELAKRMRNQLRESDTIARLGGDEFVILLEDVESVQVITTIITKGLSSMKEPVLIEGELIYPRMSIGVALYPDNGKDSDTLLKNADAAMYKAKKSGGQTYSFYTESMTVEAYKRITLEQELKEAIVKGDLRVYYQPQIDTYNKVLTGMEALVRWQHPKRGLILPSEFIAMLEESDLILELNRWVMVNAIEQFVNWYKEGFNPGVLSLNLSVRQLSCSECYISFTELLEKIGCDPHWLEVEVTESQLIQDPELAISILQSFRKLGVSIAIDDFGTGYSSLAYLKRLPIDRLKIDKSFVDDLPQSSSDVAIAKTIISLAENLDLKLIAEGVEREDQLQFLQENGCANIQGFYFSKPLTAEAMREYMVLQTYKKF